MIAHNLLSDKVLEFDLRILNQPPKIIEVCKQ